jgi:D-beta-D-heptose 7-phosphate kinase/D-beta-D-heptose 1-phosphate adenosyltransferase
MRETLLARLESLRSPAVLVLGDLMLDLYVWGDVDRVSPEAPVQVLNVECEEARPGGAANVASNLAALGAKVLCSGVVGADANGRSLCRMLDRLKVDTAGIVHDKTRPTTVKTRMIAHSQQLLRVDRENVAPLSKTCRSELMEHIARAADACDVVVISDYGKGALPGETLTAVLSLCKKKKKPVFIDPARERDFGLYRGCTLLKPNLAEARSASAVDIVDEKSLEKAGRTLLRKTDAAHCVITRGGEGMTVFSKGARPFHVAGLIRPVYDITGAGDTVISLLSYGIGGGGAIEEAAELANVAASLVVGKIGAAPVTRAEIIRELLGLHHIESHKVKTFDEIVSVCEESRRRKETVVFTNGCFDLLHVGHIRLFQFAKNNGQILVVGLNSDASVRKLKGSGRPILNQQERSYILSALEQVDYIVIFGETTPLRLIKAVRPDVLVKGADYTHDTVVGRDFVESYGGRVALAPLVEGVSSSDIMSRIAENDKTPGKSRSRKRSGKGATR